MRSLAALLALAASALAYQVTQPTNSTGWTTSGPNVVAWDMVSTDPANFTILLVNEVRVSVLLETRHLNSSLPERLPAHEPGPCRAR